MGIGSICEIHSLTSSSSFVQIQCSALELLHIMLRERLTNLQHISRYPNFYAQFP